MPAKSTPTDPISFMRMRAVVARTGLPRASIYAKMLTGEFPRPVNLGGRCVAWTNHDIEAWMLSRVAASRRSVPARPATPAEGAAA